MLVERETRREKKRTNKCLQVMGQVLQICLCLVIVGNVHVMAIKRPMASSSLIPGPSMVTFRDGNQTITVDFSDVEFYPVESFPLFTSSVLSPSHMATIINSTAGASTEGGLATANNEWEKRVIHQLINAIDLDQLNGMKAGKIVTASEIASTYTVQPVNTISGHPLHRGTPNYRNAYSVSSLGPSNFGSKKFTTLAIEADFGSAAPRHYAMARFQNRVNFGRKILRFTMWQSLNQGNPRHVWLTDANMWRESSLKPLGKMMTPAGPAILWTL